MAIRTKRKTRGKKKTIPKQKNTIRRPLSKYTVLKESGLIGCLTGTGVTSKNYKDILYKK